MMIIPSIATLKIIIFYILLCMAILVLGTLLLFMIGVFVTMLVSVIKWIFKGLFFKKEE